jgi:hypothetical protein
MDLACFMDIQIPFDITSDTVPGSLLKFFDRMDNLFISFI